MRATVGRLQADSKTRLVRDFMVLRSRLRPLSIPLTGAAFAAALLLAGALPADAAGAKTRAAEIITTRGCSACHFVPGIPQAVGTLGPSLKGFSSRPRIAAGRLENTEENLRRWLQNPKAVLPATMMPNLGLDDEEISVLIEFFQTL
jgi:cytochrome c2